MPKQDYYEVLGTNQGADAQSIKRAYRTMAMKFHPDRNPGDSEAAEKMKQVNEAYAVLSDEKNRSLYDSYGHSGLEGYTQEDIFRSVDFSVLFREFGLGDLFGGVFGASVGRRSRSRRGPDLRYDLEVTLEEVARGVQKTAQISRTSRCPGCSGTGAEVGGRIECSTCRGTGQSVRQEIVDFGVVRQITTCATCRGTGAIITGPCKTCDGIGRIQETVEIKVDIPAGVDTGYAIKMAGEGEGGEGLPGDLYIVVNVLQHPVFERQGDDIFLRQEIDITTLALGGRVQVPSLNGDVDIDVPEGTQPGTVVKIPGGGLPRSDGYGTGDQYVVVKVVTPTGLSRREKELLERFQKLRRRSEHDGDEQD